MPGGATALADRRTTPPGHDGTGRPDRSDRPRGLDARPGVPVAVLVVAYAVTRVWARARRCPLRRQRAAGHAADRHVAAPRRAPAEGPPGGERLAPEQPAAPVQPLRRGPAQAAHRPPAARRGLCALALGLAMVVCAYLLQVELRVPRVAALVVTLVVVVASPAYLLYENWLNYAYPTAAVGTVGGLVPGALPPHRSGPGSASASSAATRPWSCSTAPTRSSGCWWRRCRCSVVLRHRWRTVLAVAAVPVLVVAGWYVKDYVQVGTTTTSSWLGMNLARSILYRAPAGQVAALQRQGRMNAVASVPPFAGPEVYSPRYVTAVPDPDAGGRGPPQVGRGHQLQQPAVRPRVVALPPRRPRLDPGPSPRVRRRRPQLARGVVRRAPTRTSPTRSTGRPPAPTPAPTTGSWSGSRPRTRPRASWCSPAAGTGRPGCRARPWPSTRWHWSAPRCWPGARRRSDPALAGTLAVLWWTTAYACTTTSLVEIGENERFRSELGPVPTVVAVVVVTAAVRAAWSRWHRRGRGDTASVVPVTTPTGPASSRSPAPGGGPEDGRS